MLEQAKTLGIPSLWLQPGAADDDTAAFIRESGLEDRVIYGGACVMVEGEGLLRDL